MADEARERAEKRLGEVKGFYSHLGIFIFINVLLFLVNILTSPGQWWFYWVTIFWGIAVVFHGSHLSHVANTISGNKILRIIS